MNLSFVQFTIRGAQWQTPHCTSLITAAYRVPAQSLYPAQSSAHWTSEKLQSINEYAANWMLGLSVPDRVGCFIAVSFGLPTLDRSITVTRFWRRRPQPWARRRGKTSSSTTYAVRFHVIALSDKTVSYLLLFICLIFVFSFLSINFFFSHFSIPSKVNELVWSSNSCLHYLIRKRKNCETANGVLSSKCSLQSQKLCRTVPQL